MPTPDLTEAQRQTRLANLDQLLYVIENAMASGRSLHDVHEAILYAQREYMLRGEPNDPEDRLDWQQDGTSRRLLED